MSEQTRAMKHRVVFSDLGQAVYPSAIIVDWSPMPGGPENPDDLKVVISHAIRDQIKRRTDFGDWVLSEFNGVITLEDLAYGGEIGQKFLDAMVLHYGIEGIRIAVYESSDTTWWEVDQGLGLTLDDEDETAGAAGERAAAAYERD